MKHIFRNEFVVVAFLILFGSVLRLYHLDYPLGLHGDEAWTGIDALRLFWGQDVGFWSLWLRQPNLIVYWTAFLFHFLPPTVTTLRLSFVLLWITSIPFFYGIVRLLFGKKFALIALFFFLTDRTLLHFSHIAYSPFIPPFLISTFFFLYALEKKNGWLFVLSGIVTALSLYFYLALFALPLLYGSYLLYLEQKEQFLKKQKTQILLFLFSFLITFLPFGALLYLNPTLVLGRAETVQIFTGQAYNTPADYGTNNDPLLTKVSKQLVRTVFLFHFSGDRDPQDNIPGKPLLDPLTGLFFVVGCVYVWKNRQKKSFIFLLLWFGIFLIGTIFTVDAPNFRRIQPSIAATTVISSFGLFSVYTVLMKRFLKYPFIARGVVVCSLLVIYVTNVQYYFTVQAVAPSTQTIFGERIVKSATLITDLRHQFPNLYVYFYAPDFDLHHPTIAYLAPGIKGEERYLFTDIVNKQRTQPVLYVFLPGYEPALMNTIHLYPKGKEYLVTEANHTILLYGYLINDK